MRCVREGVKCLRGDTTTTVVGEACEKKSWCRGLTVCRWGLT